MLLHPSVKELPFGLDVAEAIMIAGEPAAGNSSWVKKVDLGRNAVEVSSHDKLPVLR
jgi:GTP1/Obg family GTP-binding protein